MKTSTMAVLAQATLALMVTGIVHVSAKGGPPTPTPPVEVTSSVFDTDAFGNPTVVQSDDSVAGSAVYSGASGVVSQIDSGYVDWNLDLRNTNRGFLLTLVTTGGGSVPGLPSGPTFYTGRIVSRCYTPSGGTTAVSWFGITTIDDTNCAMRVNFTWSSNSYTLVMSPGYAGTGLASVHCNGVVGSSCADWTVSPNANTPNAGVANLYVVTKSGSERFVAACRLTFRMHVS
jgi:hypothetical protein